MSNVLAKDRKYSDLIIHNKTMGYVIKISKELRDDIKKLSAEEDKYLFNKCIDSLFSNFNSLLSNITHADRIAQPKYKFEIEARYLYQDKALGDCVLIQSTLGLIASLFPEVLGNLFHYAKDFKELENNIVKWRNYTKKLQEKIGNN